MIKRLSFIIALICVASVASARRISETAALEKAVKASETIIPGHHSTKSSVTLAYRSDSYYVYNYAGGGFVIVSGSDLTDEVLGYSRTGSFNANDIPENMAGMLEGYNKEIEFIESKNIKPSRSGSEEIIYDPIAPMIDKQWGQGAIYNNFCPVIDGEHALVGCGAVALGEILAYHKKEMNLSGLFTRAKA